MKLSVYEAAQKAIDNSSLDYFRDEFDRTQVDENSPEGGWTVLMYACMRDKVDIARLLLDELGANPDILNDYADTAMTIAARHGAAKTLNVLIEAGANPGARNQDDRSAFIQSIHYGQIACFDLLLPFALSAGELDHMDVHGLRGLNYAITYGRNAIVEKLLASGVDLNLADDTGYTYMHNAIIEDKPEIFKLLVDAGAPINSKLPDGRTMLEAAVSEEMRSLVTSVFE